MEFVAFLSIRERGVIFRQQQILGARLVSFYVKGRQTLYDGRRYLCKDIMVLPRRRMLHSDEEDERGRAGVEAIVGSGEAWVSL